MLSQALENPARACIMLGKRSRLTNPSSVPRRIIFGFDLATNLCNPASCSNNAHQFTNNSGGGGDGGGGSGGKGHESHPAIRHGEPPAADAASLQDRPPSCPNHHSKILINDDDDEDEDEDDDDEEEEEEEEEEDGADAACINQYNNSRDSIGGGDADCIDQRNNSSDSIGDRITIESGNSIESVDEINDINLIKMINRKCESPRSVLLVQMLDHQPKSIAQSYGHCMIDILSHDLKLTVSPLDFLHRCGCCSSPLHGKDIFMYRGDQGFCSTDCRFKQMAIDDDNDAAEHDHLPC